MDKKELYIVGYSLAALGAVYYGFRTKRNFWFYFLSLLFIAHWVGLLSAQFGKDPE